MVGRQSSTEMGTEARNRSGAARMRWIRPGDVVTMDYREDRLNIHLDERGRIVRLVCG
jgi:translation initiation factor IF-1